MAHRHTIRVYYSDTDAGRIVYHARYLDFAEHARTELLRAAGKDKGTHKRLMDEHHIAYVVKSIAIEYHAPAELDDLLVVETTIELARRFSVTFLQRILRDEQELATLHVRIASVNLETRKIEPFESWFAEEASKF
jgi:acyl-CoA thioester hydrolase